MKELNPSHRCDAAKKNGPGADLKGLPLVQHVPGVIHGVDGEVEEGARWAQMEVEWHKATLDEPVGVSVEVVVHHEACSEIGATH